MACCMKVGEHRTSGLSRVLHNVCRGIWKLNPNFLEHCRINVGRGYRSRFWKDPWIGDGSRAGLQQTYIVREQGWQSREFRGREGGTDSWKLYLRRPLHEREMDDICQLLGVLDDEKLSDEEDKLFKMHNKDGKFFVSSLHSHIGSNRTPNVSMLHISPKSLWNPRVPVRVCFFMWEVIRNGFLARIKTHRYNSEMTDTCIRLGVSGRLRTICYLVPPSLKCCGVSLDISSFPVVMVEWFLAWDKIKWTNVGAQWL